MASRDMQTSVRTSGSHWGRLSLKGAEPPSEHHLLQETVIIFFSFRCSARGICEPRPLSAPLSVSPPQGKYYTFNTTQFHLIFTKHLLSTGHLILLKAQGAGIIHLFFGCNSVRRKGICLKSQS